MVFKDRCVLVLWMKVSLALEGLGKAAYVTRALISTGRYLSFLKRLRHPSAIIILKIRTIYVIRQDQEINIKCIVYHKHAKYSLLVKKTIIMSSNNSYRTIIDFRPHIIIGSMHCKINPYQISSIEYISFCLSRIRDV